jgi:ketosteroid isomerase-like protein
MNRITKAASLSIMLVALAVGSIEASAAGAATEVAAMHAVDQRWLKAYNSGDADTIASLYDEHAILLPPGAPGANGRAAIRAFLAKDMAASAKDGLTFSLGPKPDGGVSGDMGWVSGTYQVKDKSGRIVDAGKYLSVSRKIGGKWMYIRDAWNSDGPPAPAAPAAAPKQ